MYLVSFHIANVLIRITFARTFSNKQAEEPMWLNRPRGKQI